MTNENTNLQEDYHDNYYGSILDPLHGDIKLSEIEKWVLSHPLFFRLKKIRQNTFTYYVFPSANHTRFEHSIGVMHVASRIFESCKENYATGIKKLEKYHLLSKSNFWDLNEIEITRQEILYQELRLAALLHDVGHGPMSHMFDSFTIKGSEFIEIVKNDVILKPFLIGFEKLTEVEKKIEHEVVSCAFIFKIITELKTENENNPDKFSPSAKKIIINLNASEVVKMIEPEFEGIANIEHNGKDYTPFFSRIVTAFPIDADRMDYLLRDSYFSGVTYGIYDINRIYSSFVPTKKDGKIELSYKESGMDSMVRFIQSRTHLYNQVYFHKTNRAANAMLSFACRKSVETVSVMKHVKTLSDLSDFYIQTSDEIFLNNEVKIKLAGNELEKKVLNELLNRKLFKRIYQRKIPLQVGHDKEEKKIYQEKEKKIKELRNKMIAKLETLEAEDIYSFVDFYANISFKDSDKKSVLIAQKKEDGMIRYEFTSDWRNYSKELSLLDINIFMVRIYLRRNFTSPEQFDKMRKKVKENVKNEIEELERIEH